MTTTSGRAARRRALSRLAGCGLLLCVMGVSAAQDESVRSTAQAPTVTLQVNSRLVVLDVVVLDRAGHPVENLDRSQFTIYENKVPQKLRSFDSPKQHSMPAASGTQPLVRSTADLAKIGNAPVNILVIDELNTRWEGTVYGRAQTEKFLKAQPEVLPAPTLLLAAGETKFAVLHDYTQSRADLLASVHSYMPHLPMQLQKVGSGNTSVELLEQTLGSLSQIAESSRGTPGRKNVIWVGSGYPALDVTTLLPDDEEKLMVLVRRVTNRLLASRVTLYTIDPMGVQTSVSGGGGDGSFADISIANGLGPYTSKIDFGTFALATGGENVSNRNDISVAIGQGVQGGAVYYTLSYVPTSATDEAQAYRQIRVKLNDPSLHAVTRDGYFPGSAEVDPAPSAIGQPPMQLRYDIVSAAQTRLAYNGLDVRAQPSAEGYVLNVGAKALHWIGTNEGRVAEVTVMSVAFDGRGKEVLSSTLELKERVRDAAAFTASSAVQLHIPLKLPARAVRLRFVVRDAASGLLGTADATP